MTTNEKAWQTLRGKLAETLTLTSTWQNGFHARSREGNVVVVEYTEGASVPWLVVRVPICAQHEMDLERVLERNGTLAFATLLLMGGSYWFRVAVPFDSCELADPPRLVALCVQAARQLSPARVEAVLGSATAMFAHYAD